MTDWQDRLTNVFTIAGIPEGQVHTLKLKDLAKLKDKDCDLLDSLMTKYSAFEHSQPAESPNSAAQAGRSSRRHDFIEKLA